MANLPPFTLCLRHAVLQSHEDGASLDSATGLTSPSFADARDGEAGAVGDSPPAVGVRALRLGPGGDATRVVTQYAVRFRGGVAERLGWSESETIGIWGSPLRDSPLK
jgi:hypothetical protein